MSEHVKAGRCYGKLVDGSRCERIATEMNRYRWWCWQHKMQSLDAPLTPPIADDHEEASHE